jgi:hypothetical protein
MADEPRDTKQRRRHSLRYSLGLVVGVGGFLVNLARLFVEVLRHHGL